MSNLFRGLKPKTKLSRNGFDLSQKHVFTTRPGQAVPCLCVETVPGDHIEINMANLTRTMTLNTAAFLRGKFNFDFYFVPYTQLWHPFNQFINQRKDKHSALQKGSLYCPTISLSKVLHLIGVAIQESNATLLQNSEDIYGYNWGYNALRLLDMLGYGSYYEIENQLDDATTLATYCAQFDNIYINVFRLAAYQHIWYDIYRNKYFDVEEEYAMGLTQNRDYVKYFNFDDVDCTTLANSRISVNATDAQNDRIFGLFQQRYVQYKKDLLTSVMPSTQFGAVSSVNLFSAFGLSPWMYDDGEGHLVSASGDASFDAGDLVDGDGNPVEPQAIATNGRISSFDVLQLRKAEVLQRWKQLTLRAGNMVDDNFRAHFGKTPRYESDENVLYLGSHSSQLQVNPVESTAAYTAGGVAQKVGSLGATGTSVANGQKIVFDLKDNGDYGVIMCICYYTPENEYNGIGIDKANTLYEQFDFFTPEFENIGLEAVERAFYDMAENPSDRNDVLGYAPRYWMYKTALDKVHGAFIDTKTYGKLKYWCAPRHEVFTNSPDLKLGTRALSTFYVDPAQLNNIFGLALSPSSIQTQGLDFDPFYHNVMFDIKAIRSMSVLGLPQF